MSQPQTGSFPPAVFSLPQRKLRIFCHLWAIKRKGQGCTYETKKARILTEKERDHRVYIPFAVADRIVRRLFSAVNFLDCF